MPLSTPSTPRPLRPLRLAATLSMPVVGVALLLLFLLPRSLQRMARDWADARSAGVATVLASALAPDVEFEDAEHARLSLTGLATQDDAVYAAVHGSDGKRLAVWPEGASRPPPAGVPVAMVIRRGGGELRVEAPIVAPGGSRGTLTLVFSLARVEAERRSNLFLVVLASVSILGVGFFLSGLVASFLVRRQRAEEALHRSEGNFRALIEHSPDAILVHRGGRLIYVNQAATKLLDHGEPAELVGRSLVELLPPERTGSALAGRLARGASSPAGAGGDPGAEPFPLSEEQLVTRSGRVVHAEVASLALTFDGTPAVVSIARDLTERTQMRARLVLADRMASVGTLAAGVAHEINNPLAYVVANLAFVDEQMPRLLEESLADASAATAARNRQRLDDLRDAVHEASHGADRVRRIVKDLRTFSRVDEEARGAIDVRAAIEGAAQLAHNEIKHRAQLVKELGDVPTVDANESRLGQVVLNLLINAAQAIPEGKADKHQVRIATRTDKRGWAVIEVGDSGKGIPVEIRARIFDPFFTTKPVGEGTGLGLWICHSLVTSMGGEIAVASEVGRGTTFTVALPPSAAKPAATGKAGLATPPRRGRVLVVDDEPLLGDSLRRVLIDHDVVATTSAAEALARLEGDSYDLILCDVLMPEQSGIEMYELLERRRPDQAARLLFMSGGVFSANARAFLARFPDRLLEKPLEPARLREILGARL